MCEIVVMLGKIKEGKGKAEERKEQGWVAGKVGEADDEVAASPMPQRKVHQCPTTTTLRQTKPMLTIDYGKLWYTSRG